MVAARVFARIIHTAPSPLPPPLPSSTQTAHPPAPPVVTLAIFPGVLAEDSRSASLGDWYPLILMTLFNCSDLAGKNVPLPKALGARGHSGPLLWAAARALFLPLFVMATRLGAPAAVVGVLTVALGASNGCVRVAGAVLGFCTPGRAGCNLRHAKGDATFHCDC